MIKNLSPSHAARRIACPGSHQMESKFPQEYDSEQAKEGILAHTIAFDWIQSLFFNIKPSGFSAPNDLVTSEMQYGAQLYLNDVQANIDITKIISWGIEQELDISSIHINCKGRPDLWILTPGMLYIWDYKFGHKSVDAYENWQLIEYAAGILQLLKQKNLYIDALVIHFRVVQPRVYSSNNIDSWIISARDLRTYFNKLEYTENLAMQEDAPCNPNPLCSHCSARAACSALQQSVLDKIEAPIANATNELNAEQTGNFLRQLQYNIKLMEALETGLKEKAIAQIKQGERVPWFKLQPSSTREKWIGNAEDIASLGDLHNIQLRKPTEVITPRQARDAGLPDELVGIYSERPQGQMVLIAVKENEAKRVFNINQQEQLNND